MVTKELCSISSEISLPQFDYPRSRYRVFQPNSELFNHHSVGKLQGKVALITGTDSNIIRAIAISHAIEGGKVAIFHKNDIDVENTIEIFQNIIHRECLVIKGDVSNYDDCTFAIASVVEHFGKLDILVNNIAYQAGGKFEYISHEQFRCQKEMDIFNLNVVKAALPHLKKHGVIINTGIIASSINEEILIDGAISRNTVQIFTRLLAKDLNKQGIRVSSIVQDIWACNTPTTKLEKQRNRDLTNRVISLKALASAYVLLGCSNVFTGVVYDVANQHLSS